MNQKVKGIYLVSEPACLRKGSGAYRHIEVGVQYLSKYFDIKLIVPKLVSVENNSLYSKSEHKEIWIKKLLKESGIWGAIKDFYILYTNHKDILGLYKTIQKAKPLFIYERAAYLNIKGLVICKILGIQHFYENNGIKYFERKKIYFSWFYPLARLLERWAYRKSDFVFFVGLWGNMIASKKENWMNIENGIENDFIESFKDHKKVVKDKINLCFLGSLMDHHNLPLLIEAFSLSNTKSFHFHLIGSKLDLVYERINKIIPTTNHGFLERNQLKEVLKEMHVGIIPGAYEYPSHMKLFDYGAAKCIVIVPYVKNINYWFKEEELITFKQNSAIDLANKLTEMDKAFIENSSLGENLHNRILGQFTWDIIFKEIAAIINSKLGRN